MWLYALAGFATAAIPIALLFYETGACTKTRIGTTIPIGIVLELNANKIPLFSTMAAMCYIKHYKEEAEDYNIELKVFQSGDAHSKLLKLYGFVRTHEDVWVWKPETNMSKESETAGACDE